MLLGRNNLGQWRSPQASVKKRALFCGPTNVVLSLVSGPAVLFQQDLKPPQQRSTPMKHVRRCSRPSLSPASKLGPGLNRCTPLGSRGTTLEALLLPRDAAPSSLSPMPAAACACFTALRLGSTTANIEHGSNCIVNSNSCDVRPATRRCRCRGTPLRRPLAPRQPPPSPANESLPACATWQSSCCHRDLVSRARQDASQSTAHTLLTQ